jgi:hypothetical protein
MATAAGSYAFIASRIFIKKFCQFTFEPHAQIMMESGHLSRRGIKYRISHWLEMKIGREAEIVVCTTRHMVSHLQQAGAKGRIYRLPTSVDEHLNVFNAGARDLIRRELGLQDKTVLIYPGKFGGMYRTTSAIAFMKAFLDINSTAHVLVITDHDLPEIKKWMKEAELPSHRLTLLSSVSLTRLPQYLSAADIGLVNYKNFESRKYCSPVKVGEYLMCGLPYIVQRGTSEDDEYAEKNHVGIVVETFDRKGLEEKQPQLEELMNENKVELRMRCRSVGEAYRGKKNALQLMHTIFNEH